MSSRLQLKHTAYHEAGHAVAGYVMHRRLGAVTIIPDEETLGVCYYGRSVKDFHPDHNTDRRAVKEIERWVICSLAGPVAEIRLTGRKRPQHHQDLNDAVGLASYNAGSNKQTETYVGELWDCTEELVGNHWGAIEARASELLAKRRIGAQRIRDVIKGASAP